MQRAILHSDMNCFYASVEMMLNPELKNKPIAVCGSTEERHGIVLAKNELAKKAGVKTGMVNFEAKIRCKNLIIVPTQYEQYIKYSNLAKDIYYRYTDLVEPFGLDECWLDVTHSQMLFGSPMEIAQKISNDIKSELGLTVSIGVSFNKAFAKLGSDLKKPDAISQITYENFKDIVWPLPVSDLLFCGASTTNKLHNYGIYTIGELATANPNFISRLLGVNGSKLLNYANGIDNSAVMHKDFVSPIKSVGHGVTCTSDLQNNDEVKKVILSLTQDIGHKLRINNLKAYGIQICVKSNDFIVEQYQLKLQIPTFLPCEIAKAAFNLFKSRYQWSLPVRAVTVRATALVAASSSYQIDFFTDCHHEDKLEDIQKAVEKIRTRYGKEAITYGSLIGNIKIGQKTDTLSDVGNFS